MQALLDRLSQPDAQQVQGIWDALLIARRDCEAMAARGVRVSRDISRDWQETVSDLIDRVVAQDSELAQLRQQVRTGWRVFGLLLWQQQPCCGHVVSMMRLELRTHSQGGGWLLTGCWCRCLCLQLKAVQQAPAACSTTGSANTAAATAAAAGGNLSGSRPSSAAGSNISSMEDLHGQVNAGLVLEPPAVLAVQSIVPTHETPCLVVLAPNHLTPSLPPPPWLHIPRWCG